MKIAFDGLDYSFWNKTVNIKGLTSMKLDFEMSLMRKRKQANLFPMI